MKEKNTFQEQRERFEKDLALRVKLLDVSADSVIVHNANGEIIYINNAGCRMRGYSREEIFNLHLIDLIAPGYIDFAKQQLEIVKTKGYDEFEIPQKRKDGSEFITEVHASIIEVNNEKMVLGFSRDITERKKMENELRESEERFRNFALMSPVGIYLSDVQGRYQYVNKRWCEIAGLSPLEASGEGWIKGLHPDDRERIRASWQQFINTDGKWVAEYRFREQNGKVTWVYSTVAPLHDEQGKITGFLGTNSDITELKTAEAALKLTETRFRELFNNMGTCVAVYAAVDNGADFIVKDINKSVERIEKVRKEDIIQKSILTVFPGVKDFGLFDILKKVYQSGVPEHFPLSLYNDGRISGWKDNYIYKLPSGEIVAVYDDVTERQQADEKLQKAQKELQTIFDSSPALIFYKDKNNIILRVNKAYAEALKLDRSEIEWKSSAELFPANADKYWLDDMQVMNTGKPMLNIIEPMETKDGLRFVRTDKVPYYDDKGQVIGIIGFAVDITEQKLAEEERNNLAKFPAEDPFPVLRIARDGKILYANKASLVVHEKWQTTVGGVVPKQWLELIEKAFASHQVEIAEEEAAGRVLSFAIMPIAEAGYVNLYGSDITERKHFEAAKIVSAEILEILNLTEPQDNYIQKILAKIKKYTGIEAVGIRLRAGDDYPYIEFSGFPEHFIIKENYLCSHDQSGALVRDAQGNPDLECLCGKVIRGHTDPDNPFFTKGGSFWTNSTTELLATTTEADRQGCTRNQCNKEGYESVALIPLRSNEGIIGLLQLNDNAKGKLSHSLIEFLEGIGASIGIALKRKQAEERLKESVLKLQKTLEGTINALAVTTENRDPYTAGHQKRVADLAFHIGQAMGLPEEQVQGLKLAGLIHDIGKISIPLEILNKPGKLSEDEFTLIKGHSQVGYDILKDIEFNWPIAKIVLQHHERINGTGYPGKIGDGDILLESRIISVADVVEAMASDRPYRPALGVDIALAEVNEKKGQLYDSQVVDICTKLFREKGYKFEL